MSNDPLTNPDRDNNHRWRRDMDEPDEDNPDGRKVAERLHGGRPDRGDTEDVPRCSNCGKRKTSPDAGCYKCDPRARRAGAPGPVPTPPTEAG